MKNRYQRFYSKFELFIFISLVSLATFSTDLYAPALPTMTHFFAANSATLQQSLISYLYGFSISMLISGIIADYLGKKWVLLIGLFIYTISSFLGLVITTPLQLDWVRFFQGLGGPVGTVIIRMMVRERFAPDQAIIILSYLTGGMAITFALSPLLGVILLHYFSWHGCFIAMMTTGATLFFCVFFLANDKLLHHSHISLRSILNYYWLALSDQDFLFHTLTISLSWSGLFLIIVEYPFLVTQCYPYSNLDLGYILSLLMGGYLMGAVITRKLQNQELLLLQKTKIGLSVMLSAALLGTLFSLKMVNYFSLIWPPFFYLLGMALVMPNSQYGALRNPNITSGATTSLIYFIEMLLTALISGVVKDLFFPSLEVIWLLISLMILLLLLFLSKLYKNKLY